MESHISCVQYVISGSGVILCDDKIYTAESGDTFILPEGANHIYYSNPDNQFERIWLNFRGELSKSLLNIYNLGGTVVFKNVNTLKILEEIQEKCKIIRDPSEYKNETSRLFLKLVQFISDNRKNEPYKVNSVEKVRLYIDCHITENIKLSDIEKNLSVSREHIIRTFKKNYGITPHQYIIQSKIRLAMIMLRVSKYTIEEISDKLSFSDPHHFSAQFIKYMGCRPSAYRKSFTDSR